MEIKKKIASRKAKTDANLASKDIDGSYNLKYTSWKV